VASPRSRPPGNPSSRHRAAKPLEQIVDVHCCTSQNRHRRDGSRCRRSVAPVRVPGRHEPGASTGVKAGPIDEAHRTSSITVAKGELTVRNGLRISTKELASHDNGKASDSDATIRRTLFRWRTSSPPGASPTPRTSCPTGTCPRPLPVPCAAGDAAWRFSSSCRSWRSPPTEFAALTGFSVSADPSGHCGSTVRSSRREVTLSFVRHLPPLDGPRLR
jgi:hypothetical protein